MIGLGETINTILSENKDVTDIVGSKIYPLIADISTTFPFIVYKKQNYTPSHSKDGIVKKEAQFEIIIASETYAQSVEIAKKVDKAITAYKNIRLINNSDDYLENTFIQNLNYNIEK